MKMMKFLSEKIFPALFWICIMLAFDSPLVCFCSLIAAAIHEIGHIALAMLIKREEISMPRGTVSGLKIDTGRLLSYKEEFLLALGGPLINILFFLVSLLFISFSDYIFLLGCVNLLTALTNLIPIRGLDGGRMAHASISLYFGADAADRTENALSLTISLLLTIISLAMLMLRGEGWWIFAFFFGVLLSEILKRH